MTSEFSSLLDVVLTREYSRSKVISEIKLKVLQLLKDFHPKIPLDCEIMLDTDSGQIRVVSDDKDITPKGFSAKAERLARQHLISLLSFSSPVAVNPVSSVNFSRQVLSKPLKFLIWLFYYGYNFFFVILFTNFISQFKLPQDLYSVKIFFSTILLFIPVSSIVISITRKFHQSASKLLFIFFLIELPLLFVTILGYYLPPEANKFYVFLLITLLMFPVSLVKSSFLSSKLAELQSFIRIAVTIISGYLVLLYSFLVVKWLGLISSSLFNTTFHNLLEDIYSPGSIIAAAIIFALSLFILAVVIILFATPYFVFVKLIKNFNFQNFSLKTSVYAIVVITFSLGLAYQPATPKYVADLQTLISPTATFAQKDAVAAKLSSDQTSLKKYLTQASSARQNYLLTKDSSIFHSKIINSTFLVLAYPFVYHGPTNVYELQRAYNLLFTTYKPTTTLSNKSVLLSYRKVSYTPSLSGALAEVTVEEEYDNQTTTQQEVIYEFSLYPGSVITGLKLGPDLEYSGQIAPKGAAQKTYESQLAVRRDPALLEQIGTNTYRLRVYPIPSRNDYTTLKGKHQKVSFSYVTTASPDGFMLPDYSLLRNVYTNTSTTYLLANSGQLSKLNSITKFLPSTFITCSGLYFGNLQALPCAPDLSSQSQKIAILLDISLRNKDSANLLQLKKFAQKYHFDLYKYNTELSEPLPSSAITDLTFWGESNLIAALSKFTRRYDAVFIISGSTAPLSNYQNFPFSLTTPVYLIHNQVPSYELEFVSRIFQSGGMITTSFDQAKDYYLQTLNSDSSQVIINNYFGIVPSEITTGPLGKINQFAKLVQQARTYSTNILNNITKLDELNTIAKQAGIVTPYSSYIALVNDNQQQLLNIQSNLYNRYEDTPIRENFSIRSGISNPALPTVGFGDLIGMDALNFAPSKSIGIGGGGGNFGVMAPTQTSMLAEGSPPWQIYPYALLALPILIALPVVLVYFLVKLFKKSKV